eukprot:GHVU01226930.1.p1 GENE.GHVU01226930.1~~GHVU01226930.1.p1  ORF type:complete len:738 (-),score=108.76 GHVU01226930.1:2806-5019(-)
MHSEYTLHSKLGEGTFAEVYQAQRNATGQLVAIKFMKTKYLSKKEVDTNREVQVLRGLPRHPNVVELVEAKYIEEKQRLAIVFELLESSLFDLIKERTSPLEEESVRKMMWDALKGINHMHKNGVFHRDIKPENLLINAEGVVKVADLGSCRGVHSIPPYTEYISTRWYRSPECLFTDGYYGCPMDIWALGCVFYEMLTLRPLFPGGNENDQLTKIHQIMGTPSFEVLDRLGSTRFGMLEAGPPKGSQGLAPLMPPGVSRHCLDFLKRLLTYDPEIRVTARDALRHPYFLKYRREQQQQEMLRQERGEESPEAANDGGGRPLVAETLDVLEGGKEMADDKEQSSSNGSPSAAVAAAANGRSYLEEEEQYEEEDLQSESEQPGSESNDDASEYEKEESSVGSTGGHSADPSPTAAAPTPYELPKLVGSKEKTAGPGGTPSPRKHDSPTRKHGSPTGNQGSHLPQQSKPPLTQQLYLALSMTPAAGGPAGATEETSGTPQFGEPRIASGGAGVVDRASYNSPEAAHRHSPQRTNAERAALDEDRGGESPVQKGTRLLPLRSSDFSAGDASGDKVESEEKAAKRDKKESKHKKEHHKKDKSKAEPGAALGGSPGQHTVATGACESPELPALKGVTKGRLGKKVLGVPAAGGSNPGGSGYGSNAGDREHSNRYQGSKVVASAYVADHVTLDKISPYMAACVASMQLQQQHKRKQHYLHQNQQLPRARGDPMAHGLPPLKMR